MMTKADLAYTRYREFYAPERYSDALAAMDEAIASLSEETESERLELASHIFRRAIVLHKLGRTTEAEGAMLSTRNLQDELAFSSRLAVFYGRHLADKQKALLYSQAALDFAEQHGLFESDDDADRYYIRQAREVRDQFSA